MQDSSLDHFKGPLYAEHLALDAQFDEDGLVSRYGGEELAPVPATGQDTFLCDVSHVQTLLFSGEDAPAFAAAAYAGRPLEVGECAFEAVLTGDGNVASIPLLSRTDLHEYVSFDLSARSEVLSAWLSFMSSISQDGYAPYARMATEDATSAHAVLALWGPGARSVLLDYTSQSSLPGRGEVKGSRLDNHPCILVRPNLNGVDLYLILVSPSFAAIFWRSFLSFTNVIPVGMQGMNHMLQTQLPWFATLESQDAIGMYSENLQDLGLVRPQHDFVGARGLRSRASREGEDLS